MQSELYDTFVRYSKLTERLSSLKQLRFFKVNDKTYQPSTITFSLWIIINFVVEMILYIFGKKLSALPLAV